MDAERGFRRNPSSLGLRPEGVFGTSQATKMRTRSRIPQRKTLTPQTS
jgi:hypothetical protein